MMGTTPHIPMFQYSNTPFRSYASEIFLSSLQTEFFSKLLGGDDGSGHRGDHRRMSSKTGYRSAMGANDAEGAPAGTGKNRRVIQRKRVT
jgi:hypothetical protein